MLLLLSTRGASLLFSTHYNAIGALRRKRFIWFSRHVLQTAPMSALCLPVKKRSGFVRWHCGHTFDFELDAVDAREEDGFMLGGWQWGRKEWKILLQFLTSPAFHFSTVFATLFLCRVQRRFHHEIAAHNSFCFIGPRRGITRLWNTMEHNV